MNIKAEAYQEYNQAAVVDKLITGLPEVVRAMASPLANVDKITIVSTGNGHSAGMSKITGDMAEIAAQVPALFEALSGMQIKDLLANVRLIGDKSPKPSNGSTMDPRPRARASNHRQPAPARVEDGSRRPEDNTERAERFVMSTKKFSVLGVVLGVIAGALIAIVSGSWMFWLALGVAIGLLLGGVVRGRDLRPGNRPNLGQGASL